MGAVYKNYGAGDAKNVKPGYTVKAFLLPVDWIQTEAEPVGNAAAGNRKTIDDSHIALAGKGAIEVYCAPKSIEAPGELTGADLGKFFLWKPKIIIPGDSAILWDMMDGMVNKRFLVFVEDANNCANGVQGYVQFGCECDPASVVEGSFASGTVGSDGRKQYELTFESFCKFFYNGVVPVLDDAAEIIE
jgi:hypothetical protein